MTKLALRGLIGAAMAALMLSVSCIEKENTAGGTGGTTLIAFDTAEGATNRILMWDNLDTLFDQTGDVNPSRTLKDSKLDQVKSLAWGGLTIDAAGHYLYAVSTAGDVLRIANIHKQNGTIRAAEDISVFRIEGERLSGGTFEQAAIDPTLNTLYVLETNDSQTRVWAVPNPQSVTAASVTGRKVEVEGGADKGGTGLAARNGSLYGFFRTGATVYDSNKKQYENQRLRLSSGGNAFPQSSSVLIGDATLLDLYGALAVDNQDRIYVARHMEDAGKKGAPILVFNRSKFDLSYNQAPNDSFGPESLNQLRVIAHAGTKDWLAALNGVSGKPTSTVHLWKNVSQRGTPKSMSTGSGTLIKGIALDGSN